MLMCMCQGINLEVSNDVEEHMAQLFLIFITFLISPNIYAMDRCGDPDNGYMIEFNNIDDFSSKLMTNAQTFKDGTLRSTGIAAAFGFETIRSSAGTDKRVVNTAIIIGKTLFPTQVEVHWDGRRVVVFNGKSLTCTRYAKPEKINLSPNHSAN